MLQKWWFSSSRTSSNKENPENDAVLARTYLKYVRVRMTSLLRCDKEKTLEFSMDLALRSQQDCDVVGDPQVLTVMGNIYIYIHGTPPPGTISPGIFQ